MEFIHILDAVCWHDGVFVEAKTVLAKEVTIQLWVELYKDSEAAKRAPRGFYFEGVENLVFTANTHELIEHAQAGNINDACTKPLCSNKKYRFTLYLIDGLISFDFEDAKVLENV